MENLILRNRNQTSARFFIYLLTSIYLLGAEYSTFVLRRVCAEHVSLIDEHIFVT